MLYIRQLSPQYLSCCYSVLYSKTIPTKKHFRKLLTDYFENHMGDEQTGWNGLETSADLYFQRECKNGALWEGQVGCFGENVSKCFYLRSQALSSQWTHS